MSKTGVIGAALALMVGVSVQSTSLNTFAAVPAKPAAKPATAPAKTVPVKNAAAKITATAKQTGGAIRNETINLPKAKVIDLLKSTPIAIEASDYPNSAKLPAHFDNASQVISVLESSPDIPVRMEALRRAALDLNQTEKDQLSVKLHALQRQDPNDVDRFFNYGYSQMTTRSNQNGLFFLRKANDKMQNQFSALAYAMAQAEVDLNNDLATPETMTPRKMDVRYLLRDALDRDVKNHQPGFWPAYSKVLKKLEPMSPYANFAGADHSVAYVPYGNSVIPMRGMTTSIPLKSTPATLASNAAYTSCDSASPDTAEIQPGETPVSSRNVEFKGQNATIEFFKNIEDPDTYRVRVLAQDGFPLLGFTAYQPASVVEDLEGDGTYEIVVRQFSHNAEQPVIVYRATPCGFELDKKIRSYFK